MRRKKPDIDRVFHALGDPSRRAIMEKLSQGPISVSRLAEPLHIKPAGLSVVEQWIRERRSMWERGLDRLGDLLAGPDESD